MQSAFSEAGALTECLELLWEHPLPPVQWALARSRVHAAVTTSANDSLARLNPATVDDGSDLIRLARAFAALREDGAVAEGALAFTSSDGWDVAEQLAGAGSSLVVFWNFQSHETAFTPEGQLKDELPLQWSGDGEVFAEAIRRQGLEVEVPEDAAKTIMVRPPGRAAADRRAVSDHETLASSLPTLGWEARGQLERWYHWPVGATQVQLAKAAGSTLVLLIHGNGKIQVEVDYGNRLPEVIAVIDSLKELLRGDTFHEVLPLVASVAAKVRWSRATPPEWHEVKP